MCEINKADVGNVCIKIKLYNKNLLIALVVFLSHHIKKGCYNVKQL